MIDTGRVVEALDGAPVWLHIDTDVVDPLYLPAEYRVGGGPPAALRGLLRELARASELVGFELTEFEAPSNPEPRARAVQTVIRKIEPVLLAVPDGGKRVYEPCAASRPAGDGVRPTVAASRCFAPEAAAISRKKRQSQRPPSRHQYVIPSQNWSRFS